MAAGAFPTTTYFRHDCVSSPLIATTPRPNGATCHAWPLPIVIPSAFRVPGTGDSVLMAFYFNTNSVPKPHRQHLWQRWSRAVSYPYRSFWINTVCKQHRSAADTGPEVFFRLGDRSHLPTQLSREFTICCSGEFVFLDSSRRQMDCVQSLRALLSPRLGIIASGFMLMRF